MTAVYVKLAAIALCCCLLSGCVTSIDEQLPYEELTEVTVASAFSPFASPSHPTAFLSTEQIPAGAQVQVVGMDENAAWLLVTHNNLVGWMPTVYSRTGVGNLDSPLVIDPLPDTCTEYLSAVFAPDEWISSTSGSRIVLGSIYRPAAQASSVDATLSIEAAGGGTIKSDYIHILLTSPGGTDSSALILFAFLVEDLPENSPVNFRLNGFEQETISFQALFFTNECPEPVNTLEMAFDAQIPVGQLRATVESQPQATVGEGRSQDARASSSQPENQLIAKYGLHAVLFEVVVNRSITVHFGPGQDTRMVGYLEPGMPARIYACNADCSWLEMGPNIWIPGDSVSLVNGQVPSGMSLPQK